MSAPDDAILPLDLPDHGQVALPVAGVGGRVVAAFIDTCLVLGAGLAALGAAALLGGRLAALADPTFLGGIAVLCFGLGPVLLPLGFELGWRGQTPGKRLLGLRVLSADGSRPSRGQLVLRNVLRLVDFLPFGYLAGVVALFASARGQRLGDLVAGTLVIREDTAALAELAAGTPSAGDAGRGELRGLSAPLVQAAQLLAAPERALSPAVRRARTAELLVAVRRERPDLAAEPDAELWERLRRGVEAGS